MILTNMKKIVLISIFIIIITLLIICNEKAINPELKYSQEYIVGKENIKGEVDVTYFTEKNKDFDIGANKYGYAVFKNPNKAFISLKKQYKKGINLIQKEFNLFPLSAFNYNKYKTYGWQVKGGSYDWI